MFKYINLVLIISSLCLSQLPLLAQSQGPFNPSFSSNDILGGSVAWTNPGNDASSDNSYAVVSNGTSNYLKAAHYGFSIPATASIDGILVEVERKAVPINPVSSNTWTTFTQPVYVSGTATANYGSTSYSYNLPVSSATNNKRLIVVTVGIELPDNVLPYDPSITFGTVTYNGVAMTLATSNFMSSATTSNNVAVYYLTDAGLPATTGSRALVVNKTINGETAGGVVSPGEYVEVVGVNTYTDVDQFTPVSAVTQTSSTSPITAPAINNIRNGDYIVAATMNNSSSGASVTQNAGYTENFEVADNNTNGSASGAILEVQSISLAGVSGAPSVIPSATAAGFSRLVMGAISVNAVRAYDNSVMLTDVLGLRVGSDLAIAPVHSLPNAWPDVDTYQAYGGAANLWGAAWTPADINSSNFGLSFQVGALDAIASVDNIRITVYYTIPLNIALQSFSVTQNDTEVLAAIACNMDDHNKYTLTLEKAGADLTFKAVNSIVVTGKSETQNLTIVDPNPDHGINYYRVKTEETNEGLPATYSSVQQIVFGNENQTEIQLYPNPVVDYVVVETYQKITSITVLDMTGTELAVKISTVDGNKLKIENIPTKGLCTLLINTGSGIISKKIIVN